MTTAKRSRAFRQPRRRVAKVEFRFKRVGKDRVDCINPKWRTMSATEASTIATKCLKAWTSGDLETARSLLDDDITFDGPLGHAKGIDQYMSGVEGLAEIIERADPVRVMTEGDNDVCVIYDLIVSKPPVTVPTAGWYQVKDGKITAIRAYFDPRPLVAA